MDESELYPPANTRHLTDSAIFKALVSMTQENAERDKILVGLQAQMASVITVLVEIKEAAKIHADQSREFENKQHVHDARLHAVEKTVTSPILRSEEVDEIRRVLSIIKSRGVVDILGPQEVENVRALLRDASRSEGDGKELSQWRTTSDGRYQEMKGLLATLNEKLVAAETERAQMAGSVDDLRKRMTKREGLRHLTEEEWNFLRTLQDSLHEKMMTLVEVLNWWMTTQTEHRAFQSLVKGNVLSQAIVTLVIVIPTALLLRWLGHG